MQCMKKSFNCVEIVEAGLHKNWRNETWEMLDEKDKNMNVPSSAKGKRWEGIQPVLLKENLGEGILLWDELCSFLEEIWNSKVTGGREGQHF